MYMTCTDKIQLKYFCTYMCPCAHIYMHLFTDSRTRLKNEAKLNEYVTKELWIPSAANSFIFMFL